jgi:hypothetical protein
MKLAFIAAVLLQVSMIGAAQDDRSSSAWKEYVYPENGFAITLPDDPHLHKSSQMPNGTAYSVPLSDGAGFSLHTMEANDRCADAVHSQSDIYAKNKADAAHSNGFKAILFREVAGDGYTRVRSAGADRKNRL